MTRLTFATALESFFMYGVAVVVSLVWFVFAWYSATAPKRHGDPVPKSYYLTVPTLFALIGVLSFASVVAGWLSI